MPVYKFTDGRKGWYFQFYFEGKKIKKERWNNEHMESKAAALRAEHECKQLLLDDKARKQGKLTLYELFDEYVKAAKGNLKESTKEGTYTKFKNNYLRLIDDKSIWKLTPEDFLYWKNKVACSSNSTNYKNRMIAIMKACLSYGQLMYDLPGKLQFSLLDALKESKVLERTLPKFIPEDDFKLLIAPLEKELDNQVSFHYYTILVVIYYTGLRIGELAALTIDSFKNDVLYIDKDYIRVAGKDIIQPPKNPNSIRDLYVDTATSSLLKTYITLNKPTKYIFNLNNKFLCQQRLRDVIKRLGNETGLSSKYELKPHNLRHSHASNLRKLGYDEFVIAKRLGNTPTVSASTYIHSETHEQLELATKLRA